MRDRPRRERRRGGDSDSDSDDAERSFVTAVRLGVLPAMSLPFALAAAGSSATGAGLSLAISLPLAATALIANLACWARVVILFKALRRRDDDGRGWPRRSDDDGPLDPNAGPSLSADDWARFERAFWAHVADRRRERTLAPVA
jgi:hypothetical protein